MKRKLRRRATQINPYEAAAVLCALATFAPISHGQRVVIFVDNGAALGAIAKGWARPTDINALVEGCWSVLARHGIDAHFEWVPSKANLADAPSRRDVALLSAMNSKRMDGVWPRLESCGPASTRACTKRVCGRMGDGDMKAIAVWTGADPAVPCHQATCSFNVFCGSCCVPRLRDRVASASREFIYREC